MGFLGMLVSGCGFLLIGLWESCITLCTSPSPAQNGTTTSETTTGRSTTKPPAPPLSSSTQLISIAALSFLHMISGLVASHRADNLADGLATAVPLERSSVSLVFFIFAVSNLISENTKLLPLTREFSSLLALFAFGQEFLLFYLQRPDAGLESRYYGLLLVPILACVISIVSNMAFPRSILPHLSLSGGLVLQGTWLLQMAFSFFASSYMTSGCTLLMRGDGDYIIKCENGDGDQHEMAHEHSMPIVRAKAVATLQFNCHMALTLIIMLCLYAFMKRHYKGAAATTTMHSLNYEMVSTSESLEMKINEDSASGLPPPPPYAFTLDLDDDESDDKEHENDGSDEKEQHSTANGTAT